jgi:hypothetical protein
MITARNEPETERFRIQFPSPKVRRNRTSCVLLSDSPGFSFSLWERAGVRRVSRALGGLLASLVLSAGLSPAHAQNFSIDWFKVSCGGGTSTNGPFALSGTIGQHDAGGPMTGGNFSLSGGFWSLISAVQTPGTPLLSILLTSTNTALVLWDAPSTGFRLQQNSDLTSTNWVSAPTPTNDGVHKFIIVTLPSGNRFYRLVNP